jgi:hypothetical protein
MFLSYDFSMLDLDAASLGWMANADQRLENSLKHILSEPDIVVPSCISNRETWLRKRTAELYRLQQENPQAHRAVIDSRGELWQVAFLQELGAKGLLRNFILRLDSDNVSVMVEPLFPGRLLQLKLRGVGVHAAPWMN